MSRQNYYKERGKGREQRIEEEKVLELVKRDRREQPRLGGRKLHQMLKEQMRAERIDLGRDRLFRLLGKHGLLVRPKKRGVKTINSRHNLPIFKNLVKDKEPTGRNQIWNADLTYLRVGEGFMCLALISDQYSRKIVGYHCSDNLESIGCQEALKRALEQLRGTQRPIHHSDRGCQYCCHEYVRQLQERGLQISMTEQNHCYENAYAERLDGILKDEYGLGETMRSKKEALRCVAEAVWLYNHRRPHLSLNYQTPETVHAKAA